MLTFYVNRAGKNLSMDRRQVLEAVRRNKSLGTRVAVKHKG